MFCRCFQLQSTHTVSKKMYKFRIPRKNQHWVYFYHSNLKVGPFGPSPVALVLTDLGGLGDSLWGSHFKTSCKFS